MVGAQSSSSVRIVGTTGGSGMSSASEVDLAALVEQQDELIGRLSPRWPLRP